MKYQINDWIITPHQNIYKVCGYFENDFGVEYQLVHLSEREWDGKFTLGKDYVENQCRRVTTREKAESL